MKKGLTLAIAFFLILGVALNSVSAQSMLGVSEGDTFKYDIIYYWSSTTPGGIAPAELRAINQTEFFQVTVNKTMSTTVQLDTLWRFDNGTEITGSDFAEVSQGALGGIYIYAANLTAGSLLFPSGDLPWRINSTTFREYDGNFRETNYIEVNNTNVDDKVYSHMSLYFDKATGILVEFTLTEVEEIHPTQTVTQHVVLIDSNVWVIPEFPGLIVFPVLFVGTSTALIFLKRNKKSAN